MRVELFHVTTPSNQGELRREEEQGMASSKDGEGDKYRSHIYGEAEKNTGWRFGAPPNYDVVNKLFEEGRTKEWASGSLEERVQHMVKTWEMEMFHKTRIQDFKTVNPEVYTFSLNDSSNLNVEVLLFRNPLSSSKQKVSTNIDTASARLSACSTCTWFTNSAGRKPITLEEKQQLGGGYNALLQTSLPEELRSYNPAEETAESSHKAFTATFPRGFALEIIHVYSGPPTIVYKFRHWGFMEGPFKGQAPTGQMVELYGMAIFQVDDRMKIEKVEFFYDRGELLGGLLKGTQTEKSGLSSSSCPLMRNI